MTRRRIILAAVALLLAAFVMAVQRDTFVRRWCLPTPPPATRAAGPLDQVIEEFEIDDTRDFADRLIVVERLIDPDQRFRVDIRAEVFHLHGTDSRNRNPRRFTVRGATIDQLLCRSMCTHYWVDE